ncbi:DUF4389 domain-containing protein [Arthrobacter sp. AET 35A]|uniref:DUF4389 domain-containing protein n=1 Tax=Arthrobacter sp. AET 35A TaxID=2292643 RepID=UPI001780491D|nr:DUF4389 domain-containing protein [Arthrobacter sp. AET 35A]MBE0011345.1 DUF4389 domain-containing protein [Arthrobacter sp. AET 35A]
MNRASSIAMLIIGIILSLIGASLAAGGLAVAVLASDQRDDGYFTSPTERYAVASHALVSPRLETFGEGTAERLPFDVGTLRIRVTAADPADEIFIGLAPQDAVEDYLDGVDRTELRDVDFTPFRPVYRNISGSTTPETPESQEFWAAAASGPGEQEVTWNIAPGNWTVVVMNADASPGISADLQAGFRSELIQPAGTAILIIGLVILAVGVPLLVLGAIGLGRAAHEPRQPTPATGLPPFPASTGQGGAPVLATPAAGLATPATAAQHYPAEIIGRLDPGLSRWLWLVKWFLAIPHYFVLFFLWFAFAVTTIVAWFAILFTGHYPRSLFNFNVGVIRWNWRVAFYAYAAAGTDRYPPFTLAHANYPADVVVDYPDRLSRGLVLIKSWLLLIPHLLIVAAITGSATWGWQVQRGEYDGTGGLSLLGLLVLIAVVTLLFTGSYPRPLFAFIMGLNRWTTRVLVYGALMRDEYPPFRLDQDTET